MGHNEQMLTRALIDLRFAEMGLGSGAIPERSPRRPLSYTSQIKYTPDCILSPGLKKEFLDPEWLNLMEGFGERFQKRQ